MYTPALPPYKHQTIALARIVAKPTDPAPTDVFALLMEQGTGKTKCILDEFGYREAAKDCRNLLVIAPAGVYLNWLYKEIPTHLSAELLERTSTLAWDSSGGSGFKNSVIRFLASQDRPRILLVNVEALASVREAISLCEMFIGQRRTMVAVDESVSIKAVPTYNRGVPKTGLRAHNVIALGKKAYARRIATGLVAPNSPLDLFSQFEFLDWRILGFRSFFSFRAHYAIMKKTSFGKLKLGDRGQVLTDEKGAALREGPQINLVVSYRNEEELQQKIAPYSYRVLKEDCLDLPPKVYLEPREVPLTQEQAKILKDLKETAQAELENGDYVSAQQKLTVLLRMHQVLCGHVKDENNVEHDIPHNRIKTLLEVLEDHSGKAIIWTGFRYCIKQIINALAKEYGPNSYTEFWGDTPKHQRPENTRRFQEDVKCRFMIANQQSAKYTNTWHAASLVVYYSNTYSLDDRLQSEDRAHRAGLTHSVAYTDLMARANPFEMKLIKALRKKLDIASIISGDEYKSWII